MDSITLRKNLHSFARPTQGYFAAMQRFNALQGLDTREINDVCQTELHTHGHTTERAIVFIHGLTSCPAQFAKLGEQFFAQGYNVMRPRMPHHGHVDRLTPALNKLTAPQLAAYADEVIDIAQGLGQKIFVMGLSVGGVVASWIAQNRTDVERAVLISPLMWAQKLKPAIKRYVPLLAKTLPNRFIWWDPVKKANRIASGYSYPRYATKAVAHSLLLAQSVLQSSQLKPPAAKNITVITNANDDVVDNVTTNQLVTQWRKTTLSQPERVEAFEFEPALKLPHDIIAPEHPAQQIDKVYPVLLKLVNR